MIKSWKQFNESLEQGNKVTFSGILKLSPTQLIPKLKKLQEKVCAENESMSPIPEDKLHITLIHQSVFKGKNEEGVKLSKIAKNKNLKYEGVIKLGGVKHAIDNSKGKETYIVEIENQEDLKSYVYQFIESIGGTKEMIDSNAIDGKRVFHITLCNNLDGNPMGSIADTWNYIVD